MASAFADAVSPAVIAAARSKSAVATARARMERSVSDGEPLLMNWRAGALSQSDSSLKILSRDRVEPHARRVFRRPRGPRCCQGPSLHPSPEYLVVSA